MKKTILTEVNRSLEIMGLKPLILEQSSLLKFFRTLMKSGDTPMSALGKTIKKEFGTGIMPITKLVKNSNMVEVLSEVMENTSTVIRNNGQALKKRFKGAGIEISESQATALGKAWSRSEEEFLIVINRIGRETIEDISTILITVGKDPSEFQKPLIDAISGVVKVKDLDDFRMILKQIKIPEKQITEIMNDISTSGTVGPNLETIFGFLIKHQDYQGDMLKILKNSKEFQKLVREDFGLDSLAKMMGKEPNDPIVKSIYQKAIKQTGREKWKAGLKKAWNLLVKTPLGKGILYYFYVTLGANLLYEAMYGLKGKGKAGITPKVYTDVMGSEEFVERGGLTDFEANNIAEEIYSALYDWTSLSSNDSEIRDIYNNKIKSILAASQVSYFYEQLPQTSGTLEKGLNTLNIELTPKQFNVLDFTIGDVVDILETKPWVDNSSVNTKDKFKNELQKNWPRYRVILNSDDGSEWYSRKTGPIDGVLLGSLLENCNGTEEDCLDNMTPEVFNAILSRVFDNELPMYTDTKPASSKMEEINDSDFFDKWVNVLDDKSLVEGIFGDMKKMSK